MLLTAAVTKAEIAALLDALTPMRVIIDERRGRSITLGRPRLELVPETGIRLRGDARLTWDVAGVAMRISVQTWQALLVPRIVSRDGARVLAFEPVIEILDLKGVPGFVDGKIAKAIGDGLAQNRHRLAWEFTRKLARALALPARVGGGTFALAAVDGAVGISEEDVKLTLRFEASVDRPALSRTSDPDLAPRSSRRNPMSERRPEIR